MHAQMEWSDLVEMHAQLEGSDLVEFFSISAILLLWRYRADNIILGEGGGVLKTFTVLCDTCRDENFLDIFPFVRFKEHHSRLPGHLLSNRWRRAATTTLN